MNSIQPASELKILHRINFGGTPGFADHAGAAESCPVSTRSAAGKPAILSAWAERLLPDWSCLVTHAHAATLRCCSKSKTIRRILSRFGRITR